MRKERGRGEGEKTVREERKMEGGEEWKRGGRVELKRREEERGEKNAKGERKKEG